MQAQVQVASVGVDRVHELACTAPEVDVKHKSEEKAWRVDEGSIRFQDVSLRYAGSPDLALKSVSFDVKPGERIGICGAFSSLSAVLPCTEG